MIRSQVTFDVPMGHGLKIKESEYLDLPREKNAVEYECGGNINCCWCTLNGPQKLRKKDGMNLKRKDREHSDHSIVEIS